jgi:hypothetical protein
VAPTSTAAPPLPSPAPTPVGTATPPATSPVIVATALVAQGRTTVLSGGRRELSLPTLGLRVIYPTGTFAASHLAEFVDNWQEANQEDRTRLQFQGAAPMTVELRADGAADPLGLGVRGYSEPAQQQMFQLYDGSGDPGDRAYITAHELGHMLIYPKLGWGANLMLSEGAAMFASDGFLRRDNVLTVDQFADAAYLTQRLTPAMTLSAPNAGFHGRLVDRSDYDFSGSFVSFLINTYGLARFDRVYPTANYGAVYGKSLSQLNAEWLAYLGAQVKAHPLTFDPARYFTYLDRVENDYGRLYAAAQQHGDRLNQTAYAAVDAARLAVDRQDYTLVEQQLLTFDKAL